MNSRLRRTTKRSAMSDFTVIIAGPERHAGRKPYALVVRAKTPTQAVEKALAHFGDDNDTIVISVVEGAPGLDYPFHWNDLRSEANQ